MAEKVKSGDPSNIEAQASRKYWPKLFADLDPDAGPFRRDRDAEDQNRLLNYGYGVLRAIVGRAVCAAGLHPSLGLHHHNRYDGFCLADDLMEPFRPVVDRAVRQHIWITGKLDAPLDKEAKGAILRGVLGRFDVEGEQRTLFDVVTRAAVSLVNVYAGEGRELVLPEL